jgi:acetyl-CoA synthetase
MTAAFAQGDRVCIYMPMVPEAAYAMLACTRIGAIHSVVFGGFSPEALKDRINDARCRMVITADEGLRGGKTVPLKANVDAALTNCPSVDTVIVLERTGGDIHWEKGRDIAYGASTSTAGIEFTPASMDSESPLFILYTSGSTGKAKRCIAHNGRLPIASSEHVQICF